MAYHALISFRFNVDSVELGEEVAFEMCPNVSYTKRFGRRPDSDKPDVILFGSFKNSVAYTHENGFGFGKWTSNILISRVFDYAKDKTLLSRRHEVSFNYRLTLPADRERTYLPIVDYLASAFCYYEDFQTLDEDEYAVSILARLRKDLGIRFPNFECESAFTDDPGTVYGQMFVQTPTMPIEQAVLSTFMRSLKAPTVQRG